MNLIGEVWTKKERVGEVERNQAIREMRLGVKIRDWVAVLRTVGDLPPCAELWLAKMNKWADTLLHAAITYRAPTAVVDELLDEMRRHEFDVMEIVSARNQWGNTPLHCAASRGSPLLCRSILHALPTDEQITRAVLERNKERETPVFLAAVHGHPKTFHFLSDFVEPEHTTAPYMKPNGDSVLHVTIQRKYFELSFAIMRHIPDLASIINEKGQAPLDVLASIPSAFRSATHLSWWERLWYPFITIRPILPWPPCLRRSDLDHDGPPDQLPTPEAPFGFSILRSTMEKKRRHVFGWRIMKRLLDSDAFYDSLTERELLVLDHDHPANLPMLASSLLGWTPLLRATKYGAIELVLAILEKKPFAIEDESDEKKNVMLVAVEER
ncbi:uncharacterized protein LOC114737268 [Neltuma alba]|uniref:uncharacterized protein LOC114737268 n=1 Tax=Neltuma alba TaxID=207710 RepID=UPI0010A58279|nr:uncharacterized protein LOC114737268 [Prosopis alba]